MGRVRNSIISFRGGRNRNIDVRDTYRGNGTTSCQDRYSSLLFERGGGAVVGFLGGVATLGCMVVHLNCLSGRHRQETTSLHLIPERQSQFDTPYGREIIIVNFCMTSNLYCSWSAYKLFVLSDWMDGRRLPGHGKRFAVLRRPRTRYSAQLILMYQIAGLIGIFRTGHAITVNLKKGRFLKWLFMIF